MANVLPKWIMRGFVRLWQKYKNNPITFSDVMQSLGYEDKDRVTASVFLNELKNAGWVNIEISKEDSRKRIYYLKPIESIFEEIMI